MMTFRKWVVILLAWQLAGLAGSLAVSLQAGNFHRFIHHLMIGMGFTNTVAIQAALIYWAWRRWRWFRELRLGWRVAAVVVAGAHALWLALWLTLLLGRNVCRLDSFHVDRWHLFLATVDTALLAVITLTCALIFVHQRLSKDLERRINDNARLERLQVETQLNLLQSKVNPHFLFNTLSTMLDLVHGDPDKVERMILNLSDIYRKVLTWPETARVSLEEEITLVREYLEIEKIRMGERLDFSIDMAEDVRQIPVPPLILEILVENAVQHGVAPRKDGGHIRIIVSKDNAHVLLAVTDNGVGIGGRRADTGFGLYSVRQRLHLIYGDAAHLSVADLPEGGTCASIGLPHGN